jgi:palmitoyltransferase ZDHHC4
VSEALFVPPAWPLLGISQKFIGVSLLLLPYLFLYASAASDPGYITPASHANQMSLYPYDFTIYHPGQKCRTCHFLKPARSKHCSVCKHCISRLDHHCIFINNCVGYGNQHWFLLLLFTTATLITYGGYIGISLLSSAILGRIPSWGILGKGFTWSQYIQIWAWAMQQMTRIGGVALLCILIAPLVWGLLGYHLYLIWAGTTTNESMKWSDLQADMADGCVFKRALQEGRQKDNTVEPMWTSWPVGSQQIVLRTNDGLSPRGPKLLGVGEWHRVWKLAVVENLYDLGFWDNLADIFLSRHDIQPVDVVDQELEARALTEDSALQIVT